MSLRSVQSQKEIIVHKIQKKETPRYLFGMFSTKYTHDTRQARSGMIRHTKTPGLDELPEEIRIIDDGKKFKIAVKNWILKNLE